MKNEQRSRTGEMPLLQMSLITGFIAGVASSAMGYAAYYFHFTSIHPSVIMTPLKSSWKNSWQGFLITVILYGILSLFVALLYYFALRKRKSLIWGIIYGVLLFAITFFVLYPVLPGIDLLMKYKTNTIITELCMFILYGLFIGYSISYEYEEILNLQKVQQRSSS